MVDSERSSFSETPSSPKHAERESHDLRLKHDPKEKHNHRVLTEDRNEAAFCFTVKDALSFCVRVPTAARMLWFNPDLLLKDLFNESFWMNAGAQF